MKKEKWLILLIIILTPTLCGCLDIPDIPTKVRCSADGFKYDTETGEIIDDPNTGAALVCDLQ